MSIVHGVPIGLDADFGNRYREMTERLPTYPMDQPIVFELMMRLFFTQILGVRPELIGWRLAMSRQYVGWRCHGDMAVDKRVMLRNCPEVVVAAGGWLAMLRQEARLAVSRQYGGWRLAMSRQYGGWRCRHTCNATKLSGSGCGRWRVADNVKARGVAGDVTAIWQSAAGDVTAIWLLAMSRQYGV